MASLTTFIYALCEPGTRRVRYIGKANDLKRRFRDHLNRSIAKKTHLGCWLRKLRSENSVPNMVPLCRSVGDAWKEDETRYILAARAIGIDLVNANDGGVGSTNPTYETRDRLRRTKLGARNPQFGKTGPASPRFGKTGSEGAFYGRKHSQETLSKMRGQKRSDETRAKMRATWAIRKKI